MLADLPAGKRTQRARVLIGEGPDGDQFQFQRCRAGPLRI